MTDPYTCPYCLTEHPVPTLAQDCAARCGAELDEPEDASCS